MRAGFPPLSFSVAECQPKSDLKDRLARSTPDQAHFDTRKFGTTRRLVFVIFFLGRLWLSSPVPQQIKDRVAPDESKDTGDDDWV
jgi:hypothetical protein